MAHRILTIPNILTMGRLLLSPLVLIMLLTHQYTYALWLFLIASMTDVCDGWLARVLHQKSTLGRYLDPIADKLLMTCVWVGFIVLGLIKPAWGSLLILRDVLVVAGSLSLHTAPGFNLRPLKAGKVNTTIQVVFVFLTLLYLHAPYPQTKDWLDLFLGCVVCSALYSGALYASVWWRHRIA